MRGRQHGRERSREFQFGPAWSKTPDTPRNFMHENRETSKTPADPTVSRSAGEGLGRTVRMYVSEESDRGIVPRNHSNKGGFPSAEDDEGRLRIKENTFPSTRTRH